MSLARFESFILEKMSETRLPGLSAALVQDGRMIWARGFGFRDVDRGLPATPRTLYGIASVTKSFTCLAIMQLAEEGKLAVDDPVDKYLDFQIEPGGHKVLLHHLMSHTSGIAALAYAERLIGGITGAEDNWLAVATADDVLTFMREAGEWALAAPGERWFYLNEGYALLGAVIEWVSALSYGDYMRTHILGPLGMVRSTFNHDIWQADGDIATPYVLPDAGGRIASTYAFGPILADGGLISSAEELARAVLMYLGQGEVDGTRLVKRRAIREMMTPRVTEPLESGPYGPVGYGYGLAVYPDFFGHALVAHSGSVGTATSYMGFIPSRGVGVTVMANGSGYLMSQLGQYGLAALLGEDPDSLRFVQNEKKLGELEGIYHTYKGTMEVTVKRTGDLLLATHADKYNTNRTILIPDQAGDGVRTFYALENGYRVPVEFRVGEGRVDLIYERYLLRRVGGLPKG